jgi:hypothetical protein
MGLVWMWWSKSRQRARVQTPFGRRRGDFSADVVTWDRSGAGHIEILLAISGRLNIHSLIFVEGRRPSVSSKQELKELNLSLSLSWHSVPAPIWHVTVDIGGRVPSPAQAPKL